MGSVRHAGRGAVCVLQIAAAWGSIGLLPGIILCIVFLLVLRAGLFFKTVYLEVNWVRTVLTGSPMILYSWNIGN